MLLQSYTMYIETEHMHIAMEFFPHEEPNRMIIFEGNHKGDITVEMIDDETLPEILYDTGWRTGETDLFAFSPFLYPGLQTVPTDNKFLIDTTDWTNEIKTVVIYGLDPLTTWILQGIICYLYPIPTTTPTTTPSITPVTTYDEFVEDEQTIFS